VDIDPRAVQIAGLSLWLRAQRSWKNQNVKPNSRPQIRKSNIVCAEPMPGEKEFLKGFSENLKPRVLGQLVEIIFKKMELVGEAGSLLKIEEEIEEAVEKAREEFNKELLHRKEEAGYLPGFAPKQRQRELFDFADLPDKTKFWQTAEQKILEALRNYAEKAEAEGGSRLRLFVEDAAKGFAFIDLCTKRYDVVLMNPPFGEPVNTTKILMSNNYREAKSDIDAAFIDRMSDLLSQEGLLGGIYNRTQFFKGYLENWRNRNLLIDRQIQSCIDLGLGVLDGAMVETAAYTTSHKNYGSYSHFISTLSYANKNLEICRVFDLIKQKLLSSRSHLISLKNILQLPKHRISYWLSPRIVKTFRKHRPLEGQFGFARQGLITADNDRFLRLAWEVPETEILKFHNKKYDNKSHKKWAYYAKGGNYAPYYGDIHLTVNWKDEGREISNFFKKGKLASRPQNISFYFKKALTYTERTTSDISPRAMPSCCIFDCKGPVIAPSNVNVDISGMLALTNSKLYKYFVELSLAGGDGAARQFTQSIVGGVPVPSSFREISSTLGEMSRSIWKIIAERESCIETSRFFSCQRFCLIPYSKSLKDIILRINKYYNNKLISILNLTLDIDNKVYQLYELNDKDRLEIERVCGRHPIELNGSDFINLPISKQKQLLSSEVDSIVSEFRKTDDTNKFLSKNCYYADKQIEVLSNGYSTNAKIIIDKFDQLQVIKKNVYIEWVEELLSYFFGTVFGRWDIRYGTKEKSIAELPDPFDPLPVCPPGLLQNSIGYQANSNDIPADYPLSIPWSGIIVDDEGYPEDVITCLREAIEVIWKDKANDIEQEACEILGVRDLREYFSKPGRFFAEHLKRYSKSRRQAPIYWPLSTPSGSYTLWLYYHRLTDQTLYTCVNNFVGPKLKQVADDVDNLRKKSNRSRQEEKELEKLSDLAVELKDFDDELLRIAKFWKPNLNDGVQITAAPLWKLFRLKPWQNKLKKTWNVLEKGKYDWAHLAYSIWPERVIRASHKDRSYAIAHDLEDDLWEEIETGKDRKGNPKSKWVPKKLSENELKELIAQKTEGNV